jgi:uncharacterized protein YndB with AHSA1/START domain
VWQALTDSTQFGDWFGVKFEGPFTVGAVAKGVLVGTTVDEEVGNAQRQHRGLPFDITIDRMEPERVFAFRWHPYAIDKDVDYSREPMTLVMFELEDTADGVLLTVTESGFDRIPLERRATAFAANEGGWTMMVRVIEKYVIQSA